MPKRQAQPLSPPRQRILEYLRAYRAQHSYPPSVREIQSHCGLSSPSVAHHHIKQLERGGYITRRHNIARGITLNDRVPATSD